MQMRGNTWSRHYLPCPFCFGHKTLEGSQCSNCGATCETIYWSREFKSWSPELAMISRSY